MGHFPGLIVAALALVLVALAGWSRMTPGVRLGCAICGGLLGLLLLGDAVLGPVIFDKRFELTGAILVALGVRAVVGLRATAPPA